MLKEYIPEIITTLILLLLYFPIKKFIAFVVLSFSTTTQRKDSRVRLVIRLFNILHLSIYTILLITVWGVPVDDIFVLLTSIFTVIGVAMFAQWSLLSNITAGVLLFFSFPFRIGDRIRLLDKEFLVEAEIIDIKAFCTILQTEDKEIISFPNNLLLQKGIAVINKKEQDL